MAQRPEITRRKPSTSVTTSATRAEIMTDFSRCVEAQLFAISISSDSKSVTISLRDVKRSVFFLVIHGVSRFLANELRETNIVDRIDIWRQDNWSDQGQQLLEELIAGSHEQDAVLAMKSAIADEMSLIRQGSNVLVEIEAVYGATAIVLCERVSITDQQGSEPWSATRTSPILR